MNAYFADRMTNLQIVGNTVRMEFAVMEMRPAEEAAKMAVNHVLVMPLDGFVQFFNGQDAAVQKLIADGVLTRRSPSQPE